MTQMSTAESAPVQRTQSTSTLPQPQQSQNPLMSEQWAQNESETNLKLLNSNNLRLYKLEQELREIHTYGKACDEFLQWLSDSRAYHPYNENAVLCCIIAVHEKAREFGLWSGIQIVKKACEYCNKLSEKAQVLIKKYYSELQTAVIDIQSSKSVSSPSMLTSPLSSNSHESPNVPPANVRIPTLEYNNNLFIQRALPSPTTFLQSPTSSPLASPRVIHSSPQGSPVIKNGSLTPDALTINFTNVDIQQRQNQMQQRSQQQAVQTQPHQYNSPQNQVQQLQHSLQRQQPLSFLTEQQQQVLRQQHNQQRLNLYAQQQQQQQHNQISQSLLNLTQQQIQQFIRQGSVQHNQQNLQNLQTLQNQQNQQNQQNLQTILHQQKQQQQQQAQQAQQQQRTLTQQQLPFQLFQQHSQNVFVQANNTPVRAPNNDSPFIPASSSTLLPSTPITPSTFFPSTTISVPASPTTLTHSSQSIDSIYQLSIENLLSNGLLLTSNSSTSAASSTVSTTSTVPIVTQRVHLTTNPLGSTVAVSATSVSANATSTLISPISRSYTNTHSSSPVNMSIGVPIAIPTTSPISIPTTVNTISSPAITSTCTTTVQPNIVYIPPSRQAPLQMLHLPPVTSVKRLRPYDEKDKPVFRFLTEYAFQNKFKLSPDMRISTKSLHITPVKHSRLLKDEFGYISEDTDINQLPLSYFFTSWQVNTPERKCDWSPVFSADLNGERLNLVRRVKHHQRDGIIGYTGKDLPCDLTKMLQSGSNSLRMHQGANLSTHLFAVQIYTRYSENLIQKKVMATAFSIEDSDKIIDSLLGKAINDKEETYDDDDDITIVQESVILGLTCPISLKRMKNPVRGEKCRHVSCFDLYTFLGVNNNNNPTWKCPHCNNTTGPLSLKRDLKMENLLKTLDKSVIKIEFTESHKNFVVVQVNDPDTDDESDMETHEEKVINTENKSDTYFSTTPNSSKNTMFPIAARKKIDVIDLVSDDEEEPPLKRPNLINNQ